METDDVRRACGMAFEALSSDGHVVQPLERGTPREHVAWMLCRIPQFMDDGRREKAMRWLGFAQGYLWASGLVSINELKDANRPRNDQE